MQKLKFHNSLCNFGKDQRSMHGFLGANLLCTFRQDVV